jgi:CMP-N,N'-diacetyllegionaminic acid synthase
VLIPARSGSKSLPDKNIRMFNGKPMLVWSIQHALRSKYRDQMRIIVSTDSAAYAAIARQHGAETPFLRPGEISGDLSTDLECCVHAVSQLKTMDGYEPDIIVHLRPTQPCRTTKLLDDCLDKFIAVRGEYSSLRTVVPFSKSPFKMHTIDNDTLTPLFTQVNGQPEPYNLCRQVLPQAYLHNGYVDILSTTTLLQGSMTGCKILPYVMSEDATVDIDTPVDLERALCIEPSQADHIREQIDTYGYAVVRGVFDATEIRDARACIECWQQNGGVALRSAKGFSIPDFITVPGLSTVGNWRHEGALHSVLHAVFDDDYRFCSHNDIGIGRVVGWHKDKLNGKYALYQATNIWEANPVGEQHQIVKVLVYLQDQHDSDTSLHVVPGSHHDASMSVEGAVQVNTEIGDIVVFDQRITHRGAKVHDPDRILVSLGFGKNNVFTDEFETGTQLRQRDQRRSLIA